MKHVMIVVDDVFFVFDLGVVPCTVYIILTVLPFENHVAATLMYLLYCNVL